MPAAPLPTDEATRLAALHDLGILDSPPDAAFDALARVASLGCGVPISLISLLDGDRQWFKANVGLPGVTQTPRDMAFCGYGILGEDVLEVADATADPRFADNPLVLGDPGIRFYAGVPLRLVDGSAAGTLCVIDRAPRRLSDTQTELLRALGEVASQALEAWRIRRLRREVTDELIASEERLRRLYEATPAMLQSIGADGRIVAVSDTWLATLGYAREEVLGRRSSDFLTPESRRHAEEIVVPGFLAGGRADRVSCQMVRADGGIIDVEMSAVLEPDPLPRPPRGLAVTEDVTERRRAQRELVEQRQRLANIIEGSGVGTWEWNARTGDILINEAWARILGEDVADLAPLSFDTWERRTHPDDRGPTLAALQRHLAGEVERYEAEFRMRHRDGHWVWLLSRGAVLTRTRTGAPEWMFGTQKDISERKRREAAARRNDELMEHTGRLARVGGWELDLVSGVLHWSLETRRIHGVGPEYRPTVAAAIDFYAPEARPLIRAAVDTSMADGSSWDLELPFIQADGTRIWVRAMGAATLADGKPIRLAGAFQEITDRVAERRTLREANERLTLATDSGGIGIWDWDIVNDVLVWDERMHRMYGGRPDHSGGHAFWLRRIHPQDRARAERDIRDGVAGTRPFNTDFRIVVADGGVRHIRGAGRVTRDPAGRALRMVGASWDITESRRVAAELAEQHERLRVTLRSIGDAVITTDAIGAVQWLNPVAERLTGWTVADAAGRPVTEVFRIVNTRTRLTAPDPVAVCLADGRVVALEGDTALIARDGHEYGIEDSAAPIRDARGVILGVVLVFHDVTTRRRLEAEREAREWDVRHANAELERLAGSLAAARDAAERASRAKTRFLAGMSHELRTPLNGVLGHAQLLRLEGGLNAAQEARVTAMLGAGAHLLDMITSVLDMSEIEAEHVALQSVELDPARLATVCIDLLRPAADGKGLDLTLVVAPGTPRDVIGDPKRIRQVLLNLLGNAVKFTETGSVEVRLRPAAEAASLRVEVIDTGPGIPSGHRARLFHEFQRIENEAAARVEGAGLGLALSARLAAIMGGRLGHADNPAGGSVFWLELPLRPVAADGPAPRVEPAAAVGAARVLRILVVDDVAMNRDIAGSFLKVAGYALSFADGGAAAVAAVAATDFDVVLMDVRMPGVDGLEATRQIRALDGPRGRVPIVGLTAQAFSEQVEQCRAAGMDGHLAKPYGPDMLFAAVAAAVTREARGAPVDA
jgi:PAS domain S-box-containing protein